MAFGFLHKSDSCESGGLGITKDLTHKLGGSDIKEPEIEQIVILSFGHLQSNGPYIQCPKAVTKYKIPVLFGIRQNDRGIDELRIKC
jgi:hypothetical protein